MTDVMQNFMLILVVGAVTIVALNKLLSGNLAFVEGCLAVLAISS